MSLLQIKMLSPESEISTYLYLESLHNNLGVLGILIDSLIYLFTLHSAIYRRRRYEESSQNTMVTIQQIFLALKFRRISKEQTYGIINPLTVKFIHIVDD